MVVNLIKGINMGHVPGVGKETCTRMGQPSVKQLHVGWPSPAVQFPCQDEGGTTHALCVLPNLRTQRGKNALIEPTQSIAVRRLFTHEELPISPSVLVGPEPQWDDLGYVNAQACVVRVDLPLTVERGLRISTGGLSETECLHLPGLGDGPLAPIGGGG